MKSKLSAMLPYLTVLVADFYILPLLIRDTGWAILMLLVVIPLIAFICAISYGKKQGFDFWFPPAVALLFAPSIFIFYNASAWVYILEYAFIAAFGEGIGAVFLKKR